MSLLSLFQGFFQSLSTKDKRPPPSSSLPTDDAKSLSRSFSLRSYTSDRASFLSGVLVQVSLVTTYLWHRQHRPTLVLRSKCPIKCHSNPEFTNENRPRIGRGKTKFKSKVRVEAGFVQPQRVVPPGIFRRMLQTDQRRQLPSQGWP